GKPVAPAAGFRWPRLDEARLVSLSDYPDAVLVIQVVMPGHTEALSVATLRGLKKRLGAAGLQVVTLIVDGGDKTEQIAAFLKQQSVDWPVALEDVSEFRSYLRGTLYFP